eukprot:1608742-Pleurochrysis_carterae.AAC.3
MAARSTFKLKRRPPPCMNIVLPDSTCSGGESSRQIFLALNRRGGARPTNDYEAYRSRFLDDVSGVASPSILLSRSRYLLQSLVTSGRDDCGRAYNEGSVWRGSWLTTARPATSGAHDYTVRREAESPLDHSVAMRFGVSTQEREGTAQ